MPLYATAAAGREESSITPGRHAARCVALVDLGLQRELKFGTNDQYVTKHQVYLRWEVDGIDGKYPYVSHRYTLNVLNPAARLGIDIAKWMFGGDWPLDQRAEYDLEELVGQYCTLDIGTTAKGNPKVVGVYGAKKTFETQHPLVVYTGGKFHAGAATDLPPWVQEIVKASNSTPPPSEEEEEDPWS